MTLFQQLRIWLRRASGAERTTTVLAAVVVAALLGWLVAPIANPAGPDQLQSFSGSAADGSPASALSHSPDGASATVPGAADLARPGAATTGAGAKPGTGGPGAGTTGPGKSGPATGTTGTGIGGPSTGTTGTTGSGPAGSTGSTQQCPPAASGQGVTATKIDVAITILDIVGAAGNDAVGVPSPAEQQQDWQQVADSINGSGGAACRQLALHFYATNPVDTNSAQRTCLQIAADNPFVTLDTGGLTAAGASDCIPAQQIPLVSAYVTEDQLKRYYPYYLSPTGTQADGFRNGFPGALQKGYFSTANGFKKLGIIYRSCRPGLVASGRAAIRQAGIPDSATQAYDMGCTPGQTSPADFQQADLAFKQAGVTHVTELDESDWGGFTKVAGQQGFEPRYVFATDQDAIALSGPFAPDPENFDGAVDLVGGRYGEENTPDFVPSAGTARCNAIYAKTGQKPVYRQGAGYGGVACHYLWFIDTLFDRLPKMERSSLAAGMRSIGVLDAPYPYGPIDFAAVPAGTPYGKESWRVDQYYKSCTCWRVVDRTFNPPFA